MSSTEILYHALAQDSVELSNSINDEMKSRIADAISTKYDEIQSDMMGSDSADPESDSDE